VVQGGEAHIFELLAQLYALRLGARYQYRHQLLSHHLLFSCQSLFVFSVKLSEDLFGTLIEKLVSKFDT
jgi:hypothetical protein